MPIPLGFPRFQQTWHRICRWERDENLYPREKPNESFAFCACIVRFALDRCLDHDAAGPDSMSVSGASV